MDQYLWWRDGVIYQIYPRSFSDSNGDGLGDLVGIISRLDYLKDLGIDAIWLSPFQPTPDKDFGYDISNYLDVDPRFGRLEDYDHLVKEAHQRGIRIIVDLVLNHTSNQHPWFQESSSSIDNPKRDWYIWRDHPNNWQASFGGSAWEFDHASGQYYLHLFAKEQPDVNWRNPDVSKEMLGVVSFWMERGADGFRLDVFNAYFKDSSFSDNPTKPGLRAFDRQRHIHDMDQPEMMVFLKELRSLLDTQPEHYSVGETYLATLEKAASYCGTNKLHAAFSFDFTLNNLFFPWNPAWLMDRMTWREEAFKKAGIWPTVVIGNHDLPRAASRYCRGENDDQAKLAMALLLTQRGTPFLYYGEEIGMRDISLKRSEILDPAGKNFWPIYKGRDGCRSPMQWNAKDYAGFSDTRPWLPVHPNYTSRNVASQQNDPASIFTFTKQLLKLRKNTPALTRGDFISFQSPRGTLSYFRQAEDQRILVMMNFKKHPVSIILPSGDWSFILSSSEGKSGRLGPFEIQLYIRE